MKDEREWRPPMDSAEVKGRIASEFFGVERVSPEEPDLVKEPVRVTPDNQVEVYNQLDPGIRDTVGWLWANGFETCDSGDGVSKFTDPRWLVDGQVPDEILDFPHVVIRVIPEELVSEADRLLYLLAGQGVEVDPVGLEGSPSVQASYDPANGIAVLLLEHVVLS